MDLEQCLDLLRTPLVQQPFQELIHILAQLPLALAPFELAITQHLATAVSHSQPALHYRLVPALLSQMLFR